MKRNIFWLVLSVSLLGAARSRSQENEEYEQSPINYSHAEPRDAVARLKTRIAAGELKFSGDDRDVFKALLREMRVPIESQILVFSKTSFQRGRINPDHPRALYYSDDCYLGWAPGGLAEVATIDPELGPVFYSFDPRGFSAGAKTEFKRDADCMGCHGGSYVRGIPGVFARSVYPDENGEPLLRQGTQVVDYRTPFEERWGGWYVTGRHGKALHRGNAFASEKGDQLVFDPSRGANRTNLASFFDTRDYLAPGSDIVSLMVFEYQTAAQNALTRAGLTCRRMLDYQKRLERDLGERVNEEPHYDSVKSVFESSARDVVDALLFKDEAPIPDGVSGSASFQTAFAANAPRAKDGSSLKDLLVAGHLFKNRCGYLIYSDLFMKLPGQLKERIYPRLANALRADHPDPRYAYIGTEERERIVGILRQTHPDLKTGGWLAIGTLPVETSLAKGR
jgi:hypothetical protein